VAGLSATEKILAGHVTAGEIAPGRLLDVHIDQCLLQDVGGTLVMLELEALGIDSVLPRPSVVYVDHNLLQTDERNADDHRFLREAAARFGILYSPAGNGISHPVHAQYFGRPGATLLGCDSHTPGAGALGMFAVASGGLVVASAMAGMPFRISMPDMWRIELTGSLPEWVSAKDIVLELLRRHGVRGGNGRVLEYSGDGLRGLSVMDRQVIANMGTELGAVTTVFPSDERTREFLCSQGRLADWRPLEADPDATYSAVEHVNLDRLVPLIALPHSPGNVRPVQEIAGLAVGQVIVGSSANPGYRDFAVVATTLRHAKLSPDILLDVNPGTRQVATDLSKSGLFSVLIDAGARVNQPGCLGCCGSGQAPGTDVVSLRTFPRNFRGRSGVANDQVYLCSPETAIATAITGRITDPRVLAGELRIPYEAPESSYRHSLSESLILQPRGTGRRPIERGPHIKPLPPLDPLPESLLLRIALKLPDDISTDDIMPSGGAVMALRSDINSIALYAFRPVSESYVEMVTAPDYGPFHAVLAGRNYGQGSAREHAAIAPRRLGMRVVMARSFARVHAENLAAWGIVPLTTRGDSDHAALAEADAIEFPAIRLNLLDGPAVEGIARPSGKLVSLQHGLPGDQVQNILAGGLIPRLARARSASAPTALPPTLGRA
jgi:aconitate hydratase